MKYSAARRLARLGQGGFWIGTEKTLTKVRHYNLVFLHAKRRAELGLGVRLEKERLTAEVLRDTVTSILHDPSFRKRVQELREKTDLTRGFLVAADALQRFAANPG